MVLFTILYNMVFLGTLYLTRALKENAIDTPMMYTNLWRIKNTMIMMRMFTMLPRDYSLHDLKGYN